MSDYTIKQKQKAILNSFLMSAFLLIPGITAAILSNSLIVLTDVLQETSEAIAILFSFFAIRKVSRGKNMAYNFGYGKLEGFSSLFIAGIISVSLLVILINAWKGLTEPEELMGKGVLIAIGVNLISSGISVWQWYKYRKISRSSSSPIIEGQLSLYRAKFLNDTMVSLSLIIGLLFREYIWAQYIDPVGGLILAGFLAYSAYTLFSSSMDNLMDKTLEEGLQIAILRALALNFDKYEELHDIRSRRSGSDIYIEVFLGFNPNEQMGKVMKDIHDIRVSILEETGKASVNIIPATQEIASI
jgi:ferrous-iron efflux pump FieF